MHIDYKGFVSAPGRWYPGVRPLAGSDLMANPGMADALRDHPGHQLIAIKSEGMVGGRRAEYHTGIRVLLVPEASGGRDWISAAPEQLQRLWTAAAKKRDVIYKPTAKVLRAAWTRVVE